MSDPGNDHCEIRAKHIGAIKKLRAGESTSYRLFGLPDIMAMCKYTTEYMKYGYVMPLESTW